MGEGKGAPECIACKSEETGGVHVECDASAMGQAEEACGEGVGERHSRAGVEAYREVAVGCQLSGEDRACEAAEVSCVVEGAGEGLCSHLSIGD